VRVRRVQSLGWTPASGCEKEAGAKCYRRFVAAEGIKETGHSRCSCLKMCNRGDPIQMIDHPEPVTIGSTQTTRLASHSPVALYDRPVQG
jgi:hypothetical protein